MADIEFGEIRKFTASGSSQTTLYVGYASGSSVRIDARQVITVSRRTRLSKVAYVGTNGLGTLLNKSFDFAITSATGQTYPSAADRIASANAAPVGTSLVFDVPIVLEPGTYYGWTKRAAAQGSLGGGSNPFAFDPENTEYGRAAPEVFVKTSDSSYSQADAVYVKTAENAWSEASDVYVKTDASAWNKS